MFLFFFFFQRQSIAISNTMNNKLYKAVSDDLKCVLLLSQYDQHGCIGSNSVKNGALYPIFHHHHVQQFQQDQLDQDLILIINEIYLHNITKIIDLHPNIIKGIIFYSTIDYLTSDTIEPFSADLQQPNEVLEYIHEYPSYFVDDAGYMKTIFQKKNNNKPINPYGTGLIFYKFKNVNIIKINDLNEIKQLKSLAIYNKKMMRGTSIMQK